MAEYERNTGNQHSDKRAVRVPLIDYDDYLWYGTNSIGTPPQGLDWYYFAISCSKSVV
jgi:hypothetical protein